MKKILVLSIVTATVIAGAIVYLNKPKGTMPPPPVADTAPTQPEPQPEEIVSIPKPQPAPAVAPVTPAPAPVTVAAPAVAESNPEEPTNSIHKIVDGLLTARTGKHALFQQLNKEQLEGVIAELQQ